MTSLSGDLEGYLIGDPVQTRELFDAVAEKYAQTIAYLLVYKRTRLALDSVAGLAEQVQLCEDAIDQLYYIPHECREIQEKILEYFDNLLIQLTSQLAEKARSRAWKG